MQNGDENKLLDVEKSAVSNNVNVELGEFTVIENAVNADTVRLPLIPGGSSGNRLEVFNASGSELVLSKNPADLFVGNPSTVIPDNSAFMARVSASEQWVIIGTGA